MTEGIRRKRWDAVQYLHDHYVKGDPEMQDLLEKAREAGNVARKIFQMRTQKGYSQEQFAKKIGTSPSTISRLENADYLGHSLQTLRRVADALEHVLVVEFSPLRLLLAGATRTWEQKALLGVQPNTWDAEIALGGEREEEYESLVA